MHFQQFLITQWYNYLNQILSIRFNRLARVLVYMSLKCWLSCLKFLPWLFLELVNFRTQSQPHLMLDFSSVLFQFQFQWNYFIYYRYVIYVHTLYKSALRQNPSETRISTCIQIRKLPSRTRQIYVKVFVECCVRHLSVYFILYTLWMIFSPR